MKSQIKNEGEISVVSFFKLTWFIHVNKSKKKLTEVKNTTINPHIIFSLKRMIVFKWKGKVETVGCVHMC